MGGKLFWCVALCVAGMALSPCIAGAANFAGKFENEKLSVAIAADHDGYAGDIQLGDKHFPLTAREEPGRLAGTFTTPGGSFEFSATLNGDDLTLVTGTATYALRRLTPQVPAAPANPLDSRPAPSESKPPATAPASALADYTVANESAFGKALTRQFPGAATTRAELQTVFPDLARYFGAKPEVLGAYEDQKDHKSAGVAFSAQLNGERVTGFVSAKIDDQGGSVLVVYCKADAPAAEWSKLIAKPAAGKGEDDAAGVRAAAAAVPLKTYNFPDGTGSVGVAEGWITQAQTLGGATIDGPGDQKVLIGIGAEVITPNSWIIRQNQQLATNARRLGGAPPPPVNMLIAPWSPDPAEALKNLVPAIAVVNKRAGLPTSSIDQIVQSWKLPAIVPKGNAALILVDLTKTAKGDARQYRALIQLEVYPLGPDSWAFYATQLIAPRETFQKDLPVMLAQSMSVKENAAVIQQKTREAIDAQNRRFAAMQAANKELQQAFDARNKDWERNQLLNARSNANFDEIIRGYRTVEDTSTGNRTSVDLGNAHQVVENLNAYDPGRYKEIPLRDELYPLPGNGN
jgi:hypothetical protein